MCLRLLRHLVCCARDLALDNAGNNMLARIAMMAMTTSNSISVKATLRLFEAFNWANKLVLIGLILSLQIVPPKPRAWNGWIPLTINYARLSILSELCGRVNR